MKLKVRKGKSDINDCNGLYRLLFNNPYRFLLSANYNDSHSFLAVGPAV